MELTVIYVMGVLLLGLISKNNKSINLLLIITLYILFAFERSEQDYLNYVQHYDNVGSGAVFELLGHEPAFFFFCVIGNDFGLTFNEARAIVCILEVLAIVSTIRVFTSQIACILALFIIFPATADAELFRWLGGMSLVIYAIPYLVRGESKRDYLKYSVLVILATCIHVSCVFFLLYNLIYLGDKRKILLLVIAISVILFATTQTSLLYKIMSNFPINELLIQKHQQTEHSNIFGLMSLFIRELFVFVIGYLAYSKYKQNVSKFFVDNNLSLKKNKYSQRQMGLLLCDKLWYFNIVSILLIVLAVYTPQVQRLFHVLLFINTVASVYIATTLRKTKIKLITAICALLTLVLHLFYGSQNMEILMSHFNDGFLVNFCNVIFYNKPF